MTTPSHIAFDCVLCRPGCVLIQATYGIPGSIALEFPTESWLLAPTPDLKVYPLTDDILKRLKKMVRDRLEKDTRR